jgi:hypothetical protein
MTPSELAVQVQIANEQDISEALDAVLEEIGISLSTLIEEGRSGSFSSDATRIAWWVVSPFVDIDG